MLATETASLGASRALVYHIAALMRSGKGIPEELKEWVASPKSIQSAHQPQQQRICVIGAGVSGLTAAYELEKLGHKVTVFEKSDRIAGKCGSVNIDGKAYDVGGHFCSDICTNIKEYVQTFNLPTENTTKSVTFDMDSKSVVFPSVDMSKYREEYKRYKELSKDLTSFMYENGQTLTESASDWFNKHNLKTIESLISESYTSKKLCVDVILI